MVAESKVRVPISEKAAILKANGVEVYQWFEKGESRFHPLPVLFFAGGENEGHRAVKIMQEHGYKVGWLSRDWVYNGRIECDEVTWALIV